MKVKPFSEDSAKLYTQNLIFTAQTFKLRFKLIRFKEILCLGCTPETLTVSVGSTDTNSGHLDISGGQPGYYIHLFTVHI